MPNRIFEELLDEQINIFKNSFSNVSRNAFFDAEKGRLIHSGEFGTYREAICRDFMRFLVPQKLNFDTGFIINANNEISSQLDIIIFDPTSTPLIQSGARQRFFPVEAVSAVGEVKSVLSKTELREALQKLTKVKAMREFVPNPVVIRRTHSGVYNPVNYGFDQVFTFLICESFSFPLNDIVQEIRSLYDPLIPYRHFHNLILSVKDGLLCYYNNDGIALMYPDFAGHQLKHRFITPNSDANAHLKYFASYIFTGTTNNTILLADIAYYIAGFAGGKKYDEQ